MVCSSSDSDSCVCVVPSQSPFLTKEEGGQVFSRSSSETLLTPAEQTPSPAMTSERLRGVLGGRAKLQGCQVLEDVSLGDPTY